tara:strand:- start:39 stop:275 length:237 start_codon:yes stop_codon:yes gene_type:complete
MHFFDKNQRVPSTSLRLISDVSVDSNVLNTVCGKSFPQDKPHFESSNVWSFPENGKIYPALGFGFGFGSKILATNAYS